MSSPFVRPASSFDRLAFLVAGDERVKLFDPGLDLERVFECTGCGMHLAVGPCFEHIDPQSFLGAVCGCADPEPLESLTEAVEGAGRPGTTPDGTANV